MEVYKRKFMVKGRPKGAGVKLIIKQKDMNDIMKSIYKDKNNNKFKNKLVKAFRNMHLQYYIDIHKISLNNLI